MLKIEMWPKLRPYLLAIAGVSAITVLIGLAKPRLDVPNLSLVYLLLVLWLGARFGSRPAVAASLLAFAAFDFFFVPPVGTLYVSAPHELLNLVLLLAAALVSGQLAASLRDTSAHATSAAAESSALYELATAAMREPDASRALSLVCERATALPGIQQFSLVGSDGDGPEILAGSALSADLLRRVAWAQERQVAVGIAVREGGIQLLRTHATREEPRILPFSNGAAVMVTDHEASRPPTLRMLAALLALAELFMDRRQGIFEAERARQLQAADEFKGAILSSVSHELKSPLASIRAGLTALSMPESGLAAEQRELALGLDRQAARLDRLVTDLLTMTRLEAGVAPEVERRPFEEVVGAVLTRLEPELDRFHVEVLMPEDLPPVLLDELQIDRVLTNLVENALEWTADGCRITVGASVQGDQLQAWVENEGARIPPPDLPRLFDKFWSRRASGSGLGLAICRRIVEAHGGTIKVVNLRTGPRFVFTLPLAPKLATA